MTKIALLFPGQGSHAVGMGKLLSETSTAARAVFHEVDDALGFSLTDIMWNGPEEELVLTAHAQPAIMSCSMAVLAMIKEQMGENVLSAIDVVLGHSLGEYSAYCAVGAIDLSTTAKLLRLRGEAMQVAVPQGEGKMAAILGLDVEQIEQVCKEVSQTSVVVLANDNSVGQAVISGAAEGVLKASSILSEKGAKKVVPLNVSAPFHSPLMAPATAVMRDALEKTNVGPVTTPVLCNVDVQPIINPESAVDGLVRQVEGRVRWRESVAWLADNEYTHCLEIGHGKVITGMIKRQLRGAVCASIGSHEDIKILEEALR